MMRERQRKVVYFYIGKLLDGEWTTWEGGFKTASEAFKALKKTYQNESGYCVMSITTERIARTGDA